MQQLEQEKLNHYMIQRRLAHGGMSDIYLAQDAQEHTVALKVVHSSQDDHVIRFQREIQTLYSLHHEHILPILDSGADGSWHYCVMPYMSSGTLRNRINEGPLSLKEAGTILTQIADALQHAHEQGLLHRDIKPTNILFGDDSHVYLADFGLAKEITTNESDLTQTGCLIGTPEYMAPELAEQPAAIGSDIYALGIVLYQMLTGQVPFRGTSPMSIYWKHIQEQPLPPSHLNPAISPAVEQVILCAIEKDPAYRFPSVRAMAEAYNRALQVSSQLLSVPNRSLVTANAESVTLPPPVQRVISLPKATVRRRHPAFITMAAVFFLLIVPLTLGFSLFLSDHGYGLQAQAPVALGASAQFTKLNGLIQEGLPHTSNTTVTTTTTTTSVNGHSYHPQGNPGSGGNHGRGHGHKHGHGG